MGDHKTTKDDRVWRRLREKIKGISKAHVRVGVIDGGRAHGGITMGELAAIHEFGAPAAGIPERSFLRFTFKARAEDLAKIAERLARGLLAEKIELKAALGVLGAWGAAAVKKSITARIIRPQLIESEAGRRTIARKGSSTTLVDTGQLVNSITWALGKEEK